LKTTFTASYYFGTSRPRTCKAFDGEGWVMHCSSLSKSLAPGYRIGWVLPGRFRSEVAQLKRMQNISCPTLPQAAVAHFLQTGRYDLHLRGLRKALHTQCLRYTQSIIEHFLPAPTFPGRTAALCSGWSCRKAWTCFACAAKP
jgi:DNA-binding transcriptional MocR family regulator